MAWQDAGGSCSIALRAAEGQRNQPARNGTAAEPDQEGGRIAADRKADAGQKCGPGQDPPNGPTMTSTRKSRGSSALGIPDA